MYSTIMTEEYFGHNGRIHRCQEKITIYNRCRDNVHCCNQ